MVSGKLDLQKRQHRERGQPLARKKLGLLEKHADYVKRARDFHSKEDRIRKLREKAAGKNQDEFYFGMIKSRTLNGVHVQSRGNEALPTDLVKVLKTQDAGYIRTQKAIEASKVKRLQMQLDSLIDPASPPVASNSSTQATGGPDDFAFDFSDDDEEAGQSASSIAATKRQHIVFTTDLHAVRRGDASKVLRKRPRSESDAHGGDGNTTTAKPTKKSRGSTKGKGKASSEDPGRSAESFAIEEETRSKEANEHRRAIEEELAARSQRLNDLSRALRELEVQRLLMGKGAKQALVPRKAKKDPRDVDVFGFGDGGGEKGALPDAEEGIKTGARVWKWKAQRKR